MSPLPSTSEPLASLRDVLASLVLAPAVVLAFGAPWEVERSVEPVRVQLESPRPDDPRLARQALVLRTAVEGDSLQKGLWIPPGCALRLELPAPVARAAIRLQADGSAKVLVSTSVDGEDFAPVWTAPDRAGPGLRTRTSLPFEFSAPVRFLEVKNEKGSDSAVVSDAELLRDPLRIHGAWLVVALWGAWLLLRVRAGRGGALARALLGRWRAHDVELGGIAVYLAIFRVDPEQWISLALLVLVLLLVSGARALARRIPVDRLLVAGLAATVALYVGLGAFARRVTSRLSGQMSLDVDHRQRPDGADVNRDGLRFRGDASSLPEESFVVLFLGDSFMNGVLLPYEDSPPAQFEALASERYPGARIRAVNGAWVSSSPLLGLRLLRDVGRSYRPDLVVYGLDVTDFHDDLRYEAELEDDVRRTVSRTDVLAHLARVHLGEAGPLGDFLRGRLRAGSSAAARGVAPIPSDRFFVTNQPLEASRADIERGVVRNLLELDRFAREELGCPFALFVFPRHYQYTDRECLESWEAHAYEPLGPYVREPFRYFEERRATLPFPVFSLLEAFERSSEFPLYLTTDPHWNAAGSRLAARTMLELLSGASLLPR